VARRAAGLLRGGVPATRVWRVLAAERNESAELGRALGAIEAALSEGSASADALTSAGAPPWRVLGAVWRLAERSGAPLAPVLERFAHAMRALSRLAERRAVLLAGPRSTLRLVIALPPLAMLMGVALGFDPLAALGSPAGAAAAALGALLLALGAWWASALTRRVARADWAAGWEFELVAIALGGGVPPAAAARWAVESADLSRAEWVRLGEFGARGAVTRALESARSLGTPLAPTLRAEAERSRARAQAELERAAERLGVRVLLPLGVCVLPAFVLLGVVPVLLAVLGGVGL